MPRANVHSISAHARAEREDKLMATFAPDRIVTPDRDLSQTTVCLRVHLGALGNTRKVSSANVEVDADKQLIRVSKKLLDAAELRDIHRLDSELRSYLYEICLPFEIGIHLLPLPLIETVDAKLQEMRERRAALVEAFLRVYPTLCRQISQRLRTLYSPADYPPADYVRSKFTFSWQYLSFGVPGQLKEISTRIFTSEREKAAQRMAEASVEIQQVLRTALAEMVEHLRYRLTVIEDGKPKQLRESAVQKVKDFLATFDFRNVTDDQALAEQVEKARKLLEGVDAEVIRNTETLRDRISVGMSEIRAQLDTMIIDRPARKFRFPVE
jgi:hypothetical protein